MKRFSFNLNYFLVQAMSNLFVSWCFAKVFALMILIYSPGFAISQVIIERNSESGFPTLTLKETEDDFSRLNFQNINGGINQYWSMIGKIGTSDISSHFRMFYSGLNPLTSN